jgi:hypothetical protein
MIDEEKLKERCKTSLKKFWKIFEDHVVTVGGRNYIYINNNAPVLAVAHLDTVVNPTKVFNFNTYTRNGLTICKTPTLDDRLGAYMILDLFPELLGDGWADILLTEGEETGNSTAELFALDWNDESKDINRDINWICEFDRAGTALSGRDDVVLYSFDDSDTRNMLKENGYNEIARGSLTDICKLEGLGVKAFNFGVGYHENHTTKAWACLEEAEYAAKKFVELYNSKKDTRLKHEKKVWVQTRIPSTVHRPKFYPGDIIVAYNNKAQPYTVVRSSSEGYVLLDKSGDRYNSSGAGMYRATRTCALCYDSRQPVVSMPGPGYSLRVCVDCYTDSYRDDCECVSCGALVPVHELEDKFGLLCAYCDSQSNMRIAIGEVVRFVSGKKIFEVVDILVSGKYMLASPDGYLFTNGGLGYDKDKLVPIREEQEVGMAYDLLYPIAEENDDLY